MFILVLFLLKNREKSATMVDGKILWKSTSDTYIPEEIMSFSDLKLFALSSNQELAKRVAQEIGIELGKSSVRQFSDGEIQVNIEESIRGKHVFILQSTSSPVNDNLLEILIM